MAIDITSANTVSRTTAPAFDSAYTVMGWFSADEINNNTYFQIRDNSSYYDTLQINSSGNLQGEVYYPASTWTSDVGSAISTSDWYHISMVREDSSTLHGYINGVLSLTVSQAVARGTASEFNVGRLFGFDFSYEAWFNGRFAHIKTWQEALTPEQIMAEMWSVMPRHYANIWAWYPTFPNSGQRELDYSGAGRNLTIVGAVTDTPGVNIPWSFFTEEKYETIAIAPASRIPRHGFSMFQVPALI